MPINILMPALSPTMTEGKLARWLKQEGDEVSSGDVIAEIETDKATMEVEAVDEGKLAKIVVPEGTEGVQVNAVIAVLAGEGEDAGVSSNGQHATAPQQERGTAPSAGQEKEADPQWGVASAAGPQERHEPAAQGAGLPPANPKTEPPKAQAATHSAAGNGHGGQRVFASPLARRMAEQAGLDLAQLKGTGPNGRIVKTDIEQALAGGKTQPATAMAARPSAPPEQPATASAAPAQTAAAPMSSPAAAAKAAPDAKQLADLLKIPYREVANSTIRKTIARRLTEAKQTIPHFYLTLDCEIDELLRIRKELNGRSDKVKLSVNDFVIKAAALALKRVPAANASWTDAAILLYERADISVAVATPNGLITPIIKNADQKGLAEISTEMKDLALRARDGKLKPEEFQGGTFSVSNLGMFGIKHFEAVINPPQACILAIGAGEQRPVVKNGALAAATVMSCTLSVDHRAVDGAIGAEYLAALKKLIEDPLTMML